MEVQDPVEVVLPKHGVAVLESRHRADFFMPWREDPFAKVLYILGGSGRLCLEDRELELDTEQICLVPANVRHRLVDEREKPVWLLGLCLDPGHVAWAGIAHALFAVPEAVTQPALLQESALSLKRLLFEQSAGKEGWREMQVAWCGMLLVNLMRGQGDPGQMKAVDRVRWYASEMANSFYLDERIDEVAQRLGMGRRRFTQLFREVTGESWLQRLRSLRIGHACQLLSETNHSTKAIAFECGFESLPQFFRAFKQSQGMPPGEWRRTEGQAK